jgi:hypothetical protein
VAFDICQLVAAFVVARIVVERIVVVVEWVRKLVAEY